MIAQDAALDGLNLDDLHAWRCLVAYVFEYRFRQLIAAGANDDALDRGGDFSPQRQDKERRGAGAQKPVERTVAQCAPPGS